MWVDRSVVLVRDRTLRLDGRGCSAEEGDMSAQRPVAVLAQRRVDLGALATGRCLTGAVAAAVAALWLHTFGVPHADLIAIVVGVLAMSSRIGAVLAMVPAFVAASVVSVALAIIVVAAVGMAVIIGSGLVRRLGALSPQAGAGAVLVGVAVGGVWGAALALLAAAVVGAAARSLTRTLAADMPARQGRWDDA